jgi:predicted MFS family arabinose efflux permease
VAPVLITTFALTERLVPAAQLTEGLSWTLSGLALGFALGSWLGGLTLDHAGTTAAYLVAWSATVWFLMWLVLGMRPLLRALEAPQAHEPAVIANPPVADHLPGPAPTPFDEAT